MHLINTTIDEIIYRGCVISKQLFEIDYLNNENI